MFRRRAESIIDQLSCPADDLDWLVSVIHTGIQEYATTHAKSLSLQFRSSGSIELSASQNRLVSAFVFVLRKCLFYRLGVRTVAL